MKNKTEWKGYTLDELQQLRSENQADIDTQKKILMSRFDFFKSLRNKNKDITGSVATLLSYIDYITLGIALFRKLKPLFSRKKS